MAEDLQALWDQSKVVQAGDDLESLWQQSSPASQDMAPQPTPSATPPAQEAPSLFDRYMSTMRSIPETLVTASQNLVTLGQAPKIRAYAASSRGPETYEQALAREQAERARIKQESPILYTGTQAAIPLALAPLTGGATLPFAGGRFAAQGLALPAVEGAILGATEAAEEDRDIGAGATTGGLFGAALGPIGYGLGSLSGKVIDFFSKPKQAEKILADTIKENVTPDEARRILATGGEQAMIADVVPEAAYQVAADTGRSKQIIREALTTRQKGEAITGKGGQKDQFRSIMNDFTGKYDENFYTKLRQLRQEKDNKAKESFTEAFKEKVKPTNEFVELTKTPLGRAAFNKAKSTYMTVNNLSEFPFKAPTQKEITSRFSVTSPQPVDAHEEFIKGIDDLSFWHSFKRELDTMADYTDAGQRIFKKADRTPSNKSAAKLATSVRQELKDQSNNYSNALSDYAKFEQLDEGMRLGKDIYRLKTDEMIDKMENLNLPKESVKMGIIQAVKEQVQEMMDTGSVGRKVTRNDRFKAALKQILPGEKEYTKFINQIRRLEDQAYTFARVNRTVPTAENIKAIAAAEGRPSALGQLARANIGSAIEAGLGSIGRQRLPREELAEMLVRQGPEAQQTLERILAPNVAPMAPGLLGLGFAGAPHLTQ